MESLVKFSLKNSSVLILATILVALAGLFAIQNLKQELLPDIKFPVITVITPYPLAGPEVVESQVSKPLEAVLQGLPGLKGITSNSNSNVSVIALEFDFGANLREAESSVSQAVNRAKPSFPDGVQNPTVSAIRFGDSPILKLAASSKLSAVELKTKVDSSILPKIEGVSGVSRVDLTGAPKAQIRVTLDQAKLDKYKLDANTILQAIKASTLSFPVGSIQDGGLNVPVKLEGVTQAVADLAGVVVTAQPDPEGVKKIGQQAAAAQIAAARAQAQALAGVAQLSQTALQTAGAALGQAGRATGIATGALKAAGAASALAGTALGRATAADAKANAALQALKSLPRPGTAPTGAPPTGSAPNIPATAPSFPAGTNFTPPSGASIPNAPLPSSSAPSFSAPPSFPSAAPASSGFGAPSSFGAGSGAGFGAGGSSFGSASSSSTSIKLIPVTLAEVAKIELTTEDPKSYTRLNSTNAIGLNIYKTQDSNTLTVAKAVIAKIPELEKALGGKVTVLSDQGTPIATGIESLAKEGGLGALFAVLVVLVFLGSTRATLVTAISIPLSLLVALLLLSLQNLTLNVLTLGGLTIAIGRVIDNAIVVIENIFHRLAQGDSPLKAAFEGAKEVASPVTASTITTVAVFLPLAVVGGIAGEFFRPLALAVAYSILASLLVAFTVVPLLANAFLRKSSKPEKPGILEKLYRPAITSTLKRKPIILIAAFVAFVAAMSLIRFIPTNFVGGGEASSAEISLKLRDGLRLQTANLEAQKLEVKLEELHKSGLIRSYQTVVGGADNPFALAFGGATGAAVSITVLPEEKNGKKPDIRKILIPELEKQLKGVSNGELTVVAGQGAGGFSSALEVQIQADDSKVLRQATDLIFKTVQKIPELQNVKSNLAAVNPEFVVTVDQKKAYQASVIPVTVGGAVRQALQGSVATSLSVNDRSVDVFMTNPKGSYATLEQLQNLKIKPFNGSDAIKLGSIATIAKVPGPSGITRIDGNRTAKVSAEPTGTNVGASTTALTNAVKAMEKTLPSGATWKIGGVSASQAESFKSLGVAILAAIALVYLIMVATFRSLLTPFLLLVSIPLVAVGSFPLLAITGTPIGLPVFFGFLLLVGIVVTNAIVLIDLVEKLKNDGMDANTAMIEGGARRVRPIVMTALTTILALMPLALGFSEGGGIVGQPLALTVIGGLTSSTILTLFVVPALYLTVLGRRKKSEQRTQQMLEVFGD